MCSHVFKTMKLLLHCLSRAVLCEALRPHNVSYSLRWWSLHLICQVNHKLTPLSNIQVDCIQGIWLDVDLWQNKDCKIKTQGCMSVNDPLLIVTKRTCIQQAPSLYSSESEISDSPE